MSKKEKRAHARCAPSAAHRWLHCPGSVEVCEMLGYDKENNDSAASIEGTGAHSLLEWALKEKAPASNYVGFAAKNGTKWTKDMAAHIDDVILYINKRKRLLKARLLIEAEVYIRAIDDNGHIDVALIAEEEIEVIDLKYGFGLVSPEDNPQEMLYMGGVLDSLPSAVAAKINKFRHTIAQPRAHHADGPIRSWMCNRAQLFSFLKHAAKIRNSIEAGGAPLVASDDACKWCPARGACKVAADHAFASVGEDFKEFVEMPKAKKKAPGVMSDKELRRVMQGAATLSAWLGAAQKEIFLRVLRGNDKLGYKLVEGRSARKWADEEAAAAYFKKHGYKEMFSQSLMSAPQAEKILAPEAWRYAQKKFVTKPTGRPSLAADSDPRPALHVASAAEDFAQYLPTTEEE